MSNSNNPTGNITNGDIPSKNLRLFNAAKPFFATFNARLIKVRVRAKEAAESGWSNRANYPVNSQEILSWIAAGGNYGLTFPSGMGCLVDADTVEIQDTLEAKLPPTFRFSTGKAEHFQYVFFLDDSPIGCIPLIDGAYVKGKGGYALGPGSVHPNGSIYGERDIRKCHVTTIARKDLLTALEPFREGKETIGKKITRVTPHGSGKLREILLKWNVDLAGFKQSGTWFRSSHPVHGSETGSNFAVNFATDTWHCFRHGTGGGPVSLIAVLDGIVKCEEVNR